MFNVPDEKRKINKKNEDQYVFCSVIKWTGYKF